jgi:NADPH:quinone reductase-like Zn-dependent oxidoreductase
LAFEPRPLPELQAGEALVRLRFAALNHRDLWIRKGQYAGIALPCVLGSDGQGMVEAVGPGVDATWVGKDVILFPSLNWGQKDPAPGAEFRILGMPDDGTLSEVVRIPATQLFASPAHLAPEAAAALPLAGLTAHRALFYRGGLRPGEKVLVTGIGGGAAQFLLQFAVAAGAEVWVTSGSEAKIEAARQSGAKGGVLYTGADWAKDLKQAAGSFDLCVDSAAGAGWAGILDLLEPGGR